MQKVRLLLSMVILGLIIFAVVVWGSPYAPVVQPCPENIEEIWAIEDARSERMEPLVTALENNGIPLAYNAQENTFYCTLGMGNAENWPQLHLRAPGADGVSLVFVDDYAYDFCADAIREGYPYQVMAYTDTEFAYFDIVFTGMMQIHVDTREELGREDIPACVAVVNEQSAVKSSARIHHRGGATLEWPKKGIRIEFTRDTDGTHKIARSVPVIGSVENLVLLPLMADETMMRDKLCWQMYADMTAVEESFCARETAYVELFVNGSYEGIYLVMEPYDNIKELTKYAAKNPSTDSVYRVSWMEFGSDRPTHPGAYSKTREFELYYTAPQSRYFADLATYMEISEEKNDEQFAQKSQACMDMQSSMRYVLLLQGLGLTDNVFNNLNIWARHDGGKVIYHYFPWDMDVSLGTRSERIGSNFERWIYLPAVDRMISLDVGGIREKLLNMWNGLRGSGWSLEIIEERINGYTTELNDSGAFARNALRWGLEKTIADGYDIIAFLSARFAIIDEVLPKFAAYDGKIELLDYTDYESRSCPLDEFLEY